MSFLSSLFDPIGAVATGGNNGGFDSIFSPADNLFGNNGLGLEPSWLGNANQQFNDIQGNFVDNVGDTNFDELKNLGNHFKQDPWAFLKGSADPASNAIWNKVTGSHNDPYVNVYGGETNKDYQNSQNRGVNTADGQYVGTLANMIAGGYAGGELGNLAGSAYGSVVGGAGDAGNTLGGFTGANAGGAADVAEGGAGLGAETGGASSDAQSIFNLEHGGSALNSVGAYQTASNVGTGAARGAANALDTNQNPFKGAFQGGIQSGIGSNLDYAGGAGIDNPYLKAGVNGAINGGVKAGMADSNQTGYGALVGALGGLVNKGGQAIGNYFSQPTSGDGGSSGATNWGSLATGLGNLYMARRNDAGIQGQINNLNGLYAPNSAYAQQMQQTLDRQDAAGGRRSQYGTRQVELQAALANAASRNAPTLANLYQQQRQNRLSQYAGLLTTARNSGALSGLGGMFGQQQNPDQTDPMSYVSAQGAQMPQYNSTYSDVMNTAPPMMDPGMQYDPSYMGS